MSKPQSTTAPLNYQLHVRGDTPPLPYPIRRDTDRIYDELLELSGLLPTRFGDLFRHRWGLDTRSPHLTEQTATTFDLPRNKVQRMLNQALWNVARYAHYRELPALRDLLGDDQTRWADRVWTQADRRWGNQFAAFSEAVLLLAVGGIPVRDAHAAARQRMIEVGVARTNRWGKPRSAHEQVEEARSGLDRILDQVIWPSSPVRNNDLRGFSNHRPLPHFACSKTGVLRSQKLGRLVQFDSNLELCLLRQLEVDERVASYQEQPMKLHYTLDGETHEYTPDIAVRLVDGRSFIIEAKPLDQLGEFTNIKKWSALASWCNAYGLGFWVGSPDRSLVDHARLQPERDAEELITSEVSAGTVRDGDYDALVRLVGYEQLGLAATRTLLEWRSSDRLVRHANPVDRTEARLFWAFFERTTSTTAATR